MSAEGTKKRKAAILPQKPRKAPKRSKLSGIRTASKSASKPVRIDQLRWKKIKLPESFDDFEGFFGLEEVEGVEVVRDGETATFKAQSKENELELDGSDQESFEGFGDLDEVNAVFAPSKAQQDTEVRIKRPNKRGKIHEILAEPEDELDDVGFQSLREADELEVDVDVSEWSSLCLSPPMLISISRLGFQSPTPIQQFAIPLIMAGHDLVGKASTGSGKTLAYGIPIVETYLARMADNTQNSQCDGPLAMVLSPTRELAHQIATHLRALRSKSSSDGPRITTITGGLSIQKQQRQLKTADIIVGTPGRLWEVISTDPNLIRSMKRIKFLVVDEADRLLSDGHFKEAEEILLALERVEENEDGDVVPDEFKTGRQVLVFSATFQKDLQRKLASRKQKAVLDSDLMSKRESLEYLLKKLPFRSQKPKYVDVDPKSQMAPNLREAIIECPDGLEKDLYLYGLLTLHPKTRTLVFANSISAVRRIVPFLQNLGFPAQALHSNMIQKARLRAIERFTKSEQGILISTDVAARGLDIPDVKLIVHYHVPRTADAYVHRSGRTARAGHKGASILLCAPSEVQGMRRLISKVHSDHGNHKHILKMLDLDHRVVSRIKPRAQLAKRIADVVEAKHKSESNERLFRDAAEDLGVNYDSEELDAMEVGRRGRGNARKKKEREYREVSKAQLAGWKAELKQLLQQNVNVGVSERYPTRGGIDMDTLLNGQQGAFLGEVQGIDLDVNE